MGCENRKLFLRRPLGEGRPRSWALLDLEAFRENIRAARRMAVGGRLLAVMKADAYGHGAVHLARVAEDVGVAMIGVGDSGEALELRRAGVRGAILVLGDLVPSEIPDIVREGIIPVVHSGGRLSQLEQEARRQGRVLAIHLKVDTGMGRLGMAPSRLLELSQKAEASAHLHLDGLMTHMAGHGEQGRKGNARQARLFVDLIQILQAAGIRPPNIHFRNSTGLMDHGELEVAGESLSRTGALLYGFHPGDALHPPQGFRPVLSLKTQIIFLKDVPEGTPIGYDGTYVTRRRTRLGVIPFGYHDGMRRNLANRGEVLVRGRRVPVIGKISMDYTTLDISDVPDASVGDGATLIGRDGDLELTVEELAETAGTSPYDLLCCLGRRVVRIPVGSGVVVA